MASFRSSDPGAGKLSGRFHRSGPVAGSPFSQAQILHLMKTEFARARRYGFPVACMLIHVDRLEALVDLHGGALREAVRTELGKLVQDKTRGADHLGLASEDRYLIVMPHTDGIAGLRVAERLRKAFRNLEIQIGNNVLALGLSIGVASCEDQATLFFDTLLAQAEAALDDSVRRGGNRACLFGKDRMTGADELPDDGSGEG
ncbi:MAG: GGDEF domain-containing protein [Planctomycetes bacterium]|nr:GGDEF domain-containing protein [Planctomycetota bacterium]MCB9868694.1 GGDEF domain-containing protein [Planctomycetota bacterium]